MNVPCSVPSRRSPAAFGTAAATVSAAAWGLSGFATGYAEANDWDQTTCYAGITLGTPVKGLRFGASYTRLDTTRAGAGAGNEANALAGYASFQYSQKIGFHGRVEYAWTDSDVFGTRLRVSDEAPLSGGSSRILALTGTLQYELWMNVLSRLEVRWDHLAGDGDMRGYGSGTADKRDTVLLAANFIYGF